MLYLYMYCTYIYVELYSRSKTAKNGFSGFPSHTQLKEPDGRGGPLKRWRGGFMFLYRPPPFSGCFFILMWVGKKKKLKLFVKKGFFFDQS